MPSLRSIFPCLNKKTNKEDQDEPKGEEGEESPPVNNVPPKTEKSVQVAPVENNVAFQNGEKEELNRSDQDVGEDVETPGNI